MNKKQLIVAWVVLFLLICNAIAEEYTFSGEFIRGLTTQKDVKYNFGEPKIIKTDDNGNTVWIFDNIKVEDVESGKEIPEAKEFVLKFNKEGTLIDYEIIDWDKIEYHLYQDLRAEHSDKSEAEIEQAIGYGLLHSDNQWERATVHFKKAVELDPKLYFSWYNLGLINVDTEEGYNYFKKATEAKPDYPPPYYWMAYYRCRNREDKKAIPLFQKFLEVAKGDKNEAGRIKVAKEALKDLLVGREGKNLSMMRRPSEENE